MGKYRNKKERSNTNCTRILKIMAEKKYSTGTKGRLKKHADDCKDVIKLACKDNSLALEFIKQIDPDYSDVNWQQFPSMQHCRVAVAEWLGEEPPKIEEPKALTASVIKETLAKRSKKDKFIAQADIMALLDSESNWLNSPEGKEELKGFSKEDALAYYVGRLQIQVEEL